MSADNPPAFLGVRPKGCGWSIYVLTIELNHNIWYNKDENFFEKGAVHFCMEIRLPDLETFKVLSFSNELSCLTIGEPVIINASMGWVRPFGLLYTVAALKELRSRYPDIPFQMRIGNTNGVTYAAHMGFFKSVSMSIAYGKEPGEAIGNSDYIPITKVNTAYLQQQAVTSGHYWELGQTIENESRWLAQVISQGNREIILLLTYVIREIIRNTPEHAGTDEVWLCGQHWRDGTAEIAIMDEGIGILSSLQKNHIHRQYIDDDEAALRSCVKAGISQAFNPAGRSRSDSEWSNSGYGLYVVSRLCSTLGGSFCIASGEKYLHIDSRGVLKIGDTHMKGTAVKMTMSVTRLSNANALIQQIAKEGQEQAKMIRNAFRAASTPSKGLIVGL